MAPLPNTSHDGYMYIPAIVFVTRGNNKTVRYVLTQEDYLNLLRSVEYEGEPRDGVAWALLQRFAFLYPSYKSLTTFLKTYVQHINPKWFPNGEKHLDWLSVLRNAERYTEFEDEVKNAKHRVNLAEVPLEKISISTREVLDTVFTLNISPVPGAVHYRAPTVMTKSEDEAKQARDNFCKLHHFFASIDYGNASKHNWFWSLTSSVNFNVQTTLVKVKI